MAEKHMLTKEDIRLIFTLWETKRPREIADTIGCSVSRIYSIARLMREKGMILPKKYFGGSVEHLVNEVLNEF